MIDFLGIGAQKAGTTWLYRHLSSHPQILFPGGKECHFWDLVTPKAYDRWLSIFKRDECSGHLNPTVKSGEITPSYSLLGQDIIQAIHACAPQLLIFLSIRNPIERAWSAACMDLCRRQIRHAEASDEWLLDHIKSTPSRQRGDYQAIIQRWTSVFPNDQFHILLFDDIVLNPLSLLHNLAHFLRIDPRLYPPDARLSMPVLPALAPSLQQIQTRLSRPSLAERPSVLEALHELYDHQIIALQSFLGVSLDSWILNEYNDSSPVRQDASEVGVGGPGFAMVKQLITVNHQEVDTINHG